jgi:hypothetical protein
MWRSLISRNLRRTSRASDMLAQRENRGDWLEKTIRRLLELAS